MPTKLVFESSLVHQVMRLEEDVEVEPVIAMELEFTDGPQIYTKDACSVNDLPWSLHIRRQGPAQSEPLPPCTMRFIPEEDKSRCKFDLHQSPERYAAMLEMFRGGNVCEMTVIVEGFVDKPDYSKLWDTDSEAVIAVKSVCFEFPLPQNEA